MIVALACAWASLILDLPPAHAMHRARQLAEAPPWVAHVLDVEAPGGIECTGSLIGPRHVLTAGRCAVDLELLIGSVLRATDPAVSSAANRWTAVAPGSRRVVLGRGDLDDTSAGVDRTVTAVHVHPGYSNTISFTSAGKGPKRVRCDRSDHKKSCLRVEGERSAAHDVAVLELAAAVPFEPVALGRTRASGATSSVYGFGEVSGGEDDRLLSIGLFHEAGDCAPPVPGFCATGSGRTRIAPGDSGGPWLQTIDGQMVQVGVTAGVSSAGSTARVADVGAEHGWIAAVAGLAGRSSNRILTFGPGEVGDIAEGLYIESVLERVGYDVDATWFLPEDLSDYGSIWHFGAEAPISPSDAERLIAFARSGGGLYLTGERPCCEALNASVQNIVRALVPNGQAVTVGGQGDLCGCVVDMPVSPNVVGGVAERPFRLSTWTPVAAGVLGNVGADNVFASHEARTAAAVWDSPDVLGGGRLAVFMDINWVQSQWWTEDTAATAYETTLNLALFLNSLAAPP